MGNELSKYNDTKTCTKNVIIEDMGDTKRIMKIRTNDPHFKHGEIMSVPREFKSLSTDEKRRALKAMEEDGLSRTEMAYYTDLSAGRISQLIGKKRKPSEKELYVTFESDI